MNDLKKHLNIDYNDDDAYLAELYEVACAAVETYLQAPLAEFAGEGGAFVPAIRHAIRLLVGAYYANREAVAYTSAIEVPFGVQSLLLPLKKFASQ